MNHSPRRIIHPIDNRILTEMKTKLLLVLLPYLALNTGTQAAVTDYWGFAVRSGGSPRLYGYTSAGDATSLGFLSSTSYRVNHLATDIANNLVIYALMDTTTDDINSIWARNFSNSLLVDITNGFDLTATVGATSGGASFYNGNYYLWDDDGPDQGLIRFGFDENGLITSMVKPYGNDTTLSNALGDIAIDGSGIMYTLDAFSKLYRMDLNNPLANLVFLGDYSAYTGGNGQIFIDEQGRLITRQSGTGDWLSLNPLEPGVLETLPGASSTVGFVFDDLSEGRPPGTVIPEPTGLLLGAAGGILGLLRRRRQS